MRLISCGYNFIHREGIWIDRPAGAGNYAFVFFRSEAEIHIGSQTYEVDKNSYILVAPTTPYAYGSSSTFVNDWLHAEGEDIAPFLDRIHFPLDTPVLSQHPPSISRSLMELNSIHSLGGPLRDEIIHLELQSLFARLSNWQQREPISAKANEYYLPFMELRNEFYSSPQDHRSVDSLAKRVNLSKSYFQHLYKDLFGCSVTADIINGRLEYAKYLLDNSTLSVQAIAKLCGYENDTHFMRQFKKFIGITPSGYRRRN